MVVFLSLISNSFVMFDSGLSPRLDAYAQSVSSLLFDVFHVRLDCYFHSDHYYIAIVRPSARVGILCTKKRSEFSKTLTTLLEFCNAYSLCSSDFDFSCLPDVDDDSDDSV